MWDRGKRGRVSFNPPTTELINTFYSMDINECLKYSPMSWGPPEGSEGRKASMYMWFY